jgi:hypothetical protein
MTYLPSWPMASTFSRCRLLKENSIVIWSSRASWKSSSVQIARRKDR